MEEVQSFNGNDVLVNAHGQPTIPLQEKFELALTPSLQKLLKHAKDEYREKGTHVLCITDGILQWEYKGKEVHTPILLIPIEYKIDKVKKVVEFTADPEVYDLNPFLHRVMLKEYELELPEFKPFENKWKEHQVAWKERGFESELTAASYLGNFHHHRFDIIRDLEYLKDDELWADNLKELLHEVGSAHYESIGLPARQLYPSDNDQLKVFREVTDKNLVVHGPPGTGKSQVLANLISKLIYGGHTGLVVSEKRAALEVLRNKLKTFELDRFLFFPDTLNESRSVIQQLKATWDWCEAYQPMRSMHLELSSQLLDSLQFKLDVLTRQDLIGGISFHRFKEFLKGRDLEKVLFDGSTTSIAEYLSKKEIIEELFSKGVTELMKTLPQHLLSKSSLFSLDQKVKSLRLAFRDIHEEFEVSTKGEVEKLMKLASFAQMMANEQHQPYFKLLNPNSTDLNKFNRQYNSLKRVNKELELYEDQVKNWKVHPTKEEAEGLLERLESDSFFSKYRAKRRVASLLASNFVSPTEALEKWLKYSELNAKKVNHEKNLLNLGISTEQEMRWIQALQLKLNEDDYRNWKKTSLTKNTQLASWNAELHVFYQNLKTYFKVHDKQNLNELFASFEKNFPSLLEVSDKANKLSDLLYNHIGQVQDLENLELQILKNNWVKFVSQFNAFSNFDMERLSEDVREIITLQDSEGKEFAEKIKNRVHQRFESHHKLLKIGTKKLSKSQRELKQRLKAGRAILVKEFGKTRQHPTLRELLNSDAFEWIKVLMPIWMLNPTQVSKYFEPDKEQFDLAMFDEASQIPLSNALGAVQRAHRILVAGDEQQMSPHYYFKAGEADPVDLLHQSQYAWKKIMLRHHYRSEHPELIKFSNKHFYDDKLIVYPSAEIKDRVLHRHYCVDGSFIERENEKEAKIAVDLLLEQIKKEDISLGVVAFSETQLDCIRRLIPSEAKEKIEQRVEDGKLFFKALENLQGEEADVLIISTGYAKNQEGKLLLNFGPLNRAGGDKRINVLLTRSKKEMHFVTSLKAADLELSQNDALNLLRQFLRMIEGELETELSFPFALQAEVDAEANGQRKVLINGIFKNEVNALELVTLHRVLEDRKWLVSYA